MNPEVFAQMADVERDHWWFVARRQVIETLLRNMNLGEDADLLEIGCGTGGNLELLARFGNLHAMELDPTARELANRRGVCEVVPGSLPDATPFAERKFDLILMLDVLEHIEDDIGALAAARNLLKPSGHLLLTVPAYQWLWSDHDVVHHHHRRYNSGTLRRCVEHAGLSHASLGYFNTFLFPPIACVRLMQKALNRTSHAALSIPSKRLNALLEGIFAMERHLISRISFPFGTSLFAILECDRR